MITNSNAQPYCTSENPFRLTSGECAPFKNACNKISDPQCEEIKNACKILYNNLNITQNQSQSANKTIDRAEEIKNLVNRNKIFSISLCISIIINIILLILGIVYRKYKKFGFRACSRKKKTYSADENYPLTEKDNYQDKILSNSTSVSNNITFYTILFYPDGIDQEPIELYVHNNHNIVQVKQLICAKLQHAKYDDYKIMKLKYNGIILDDDNQYLLENIDKSNTIVNCFIDSSMNARDIVIVKLQGKMRLPDIIQINKNQTIDQLKEIIGKIVNLKDFSLFKQTNEKIQTEELKDNLNNLIDGDLIRIVTKESGKLVIRSIFDEDSITIDYVNVDLVSSLMTSISNKNNFELDNFVLFYNNKCLKEEKYIFEYQISSKSDVKYSYFMKWAGINMDDDYITKGNFSELRYGTFEKTNRKILIKKYEVKSSKKWKDEEFMLNELITFQITKFHERFIQLLGVYIDDATLYVVMENMDGGTLKSFLQENYEKLDKEKIYKWSAQILEGLKFLHKNKVIHRDLNPSSILVDGNDDLKLSSFNLSKYLDIYKPSSIMAKREKKEDLPVRYMAPEILNSDIYVEACDVWSFGAVLIRIVTNKKPFSNSTKNEALKQISNKKLIEYRLLDKYSEFKSIIDSCLKYESNQREKIEKLIDNENIGKYIMRNN